MGETPLDNAISGRHIKVIDMLHSAQSAGYKVNHYCVECIKWIIM